MNINLKLISLIFIVFFISVSAVAADDTISLDNNTNEKVNDNTNINEANNDHSVEIKDLNDLRNQVFKTKAGDTLELDCDYANGINGETPLGVTIDREITLDGKGHTINGNNSSLLYIRSGITNVVIQNIIFINGERNCGGAIFADSNSNYLTIKNCTFINNKATTSNVGGAVYIKSSYCTISDNVFENNSAPSSGGGIRIEGNSNIISNNIFYGNIATNALGGAINALGNNIKITDNKFRDNIAGRDGGAIDIEGTKVADKGTNNIISNNVFDSNKVTGSKEGSKGGAISIAGQKCEISNNNFTNNHADTLGGAIRWNGATSNSGLITKNKFENNDAESGGAIYVAGSGITITSNTFDGHKSTKYAGGTIDIKGDSAVISNNNIANSHSKTSGGAIYIDGKSAKITNNDIIMCSAEDAAGAVYLTGATATLTGNKFINNTAEKLAGALEIKSSNANIKNNEFTKNVAKSSGGAAYIVGAKITLDNNEFNKNRAGATSVGGAVRWSGNDGTITNNKFIENTANVGFAIYGSGELKKLSHNTYSPKKTNTERWEKTKVKLTTPTKIFKKSAKTKKVTITLKSVNNKALNKKKITLTINKKTYKATTNSKGQVTINIKLTKKGTFKYTAKFAGDTYYNTLSKKGTVKIK